MAERITTTDGVLYMDGRMLGAPEADKLAAERGFACAEDLVKALAAPSSGSLETLAGQLFDAKRAEDAAKKSRIEAEEAVAALVETPANGSKTVDVGNGVKVTVKRAMGYKADVDAIRNMNVAEGVIPVKMTEPKPAEYVFDEKAYENIVENHPDVAAQLAEFVTVTPRKVQVSLKLG